MKPMQVKVNLRIPFIGHVEGTWEPSDAEQRAAWELYIELVTRVSVVEIDPSEGRLREALSSLYSLFATTRDILKSHGPSVAVKTRSGITFGGLAVAVLNGQVRPLLTKWHPELTSYEATCPQGEDPIGYERRWEKAGQLRSELEATRRSLIEFARLLGKVANVESLLPDDLPKRDGTK